MKREMATPVVVDLRNIYRPDGMAQHGFIYESVGRAQGQSSSTSAFHTDAFRG